MTQKTASLEGSTVVQYQHVVPFLPVSYCVLPFPRVLDIVSTEAVIGRGSVRIPSTHNSTHRAQVFDRS